MLEHASERPVFFTVEKTKCLKNYDGTQCLLKAPHEIFLRWFDKLPAQTEFKISNYEFSKKGSTLIVYLMNDTLHFEAGLAFMLSKRNIGFVVYNDRKTDDRFAHSDLLKQDAMDTFIDFLDTNLLLIYGVLNHSLDWVQQALIEGALPDLPFFDENHQSLLHYCYAIPQDYTSSIRQTGRELIYWNADTEALLAILPKAYFFNSPATQNALDDIKQIRNVINIIYKTLAQKDTIYSSDYADFDDDISKPLPFLMHIYAKASLVSPDHAFLAEDIQKMTLKNNRNQTSTSRTTYSQQLEIIRHALNPEKRTIIAGRELVLKPVPVNPAGTFCGLGNFILDPLKRNTFMGHCLEGKSLKLILPEAEWHNGLGANALTVKTIRLKKAIDSGDISKIKGILVWFKKWIDTPMLSGRIDTTLQRFWIEAAKNYKYEIVELLVQAQRKISLKQAAQTLYKNEDTRITGMLLPFSPYCGPVIMQVMAKNFPTDISAQIISFMGMISLKKYFMITDVPLVDRLLMVKTLYLKSAVKNGSYCEIEEIITWISRCNERSMDSTILLMNTLESLCNIATKKNDPTLTAILVKYSEILSIQIDYGLNPNKAHPLAHLQHDVSSVIDEPVNVFQTANSPEKTHPSERQKWMFFSSIVEMPEKLKETILEHYCTL